MKVGNRDWKRQNVNLRRRLYDNIQMKFKKYMNECVLLTTAWRFLRLRMQEWPPIWRVAGNILN